MAQVLSAVRRNAGWVLVLIALLALAGCGGGGSSSGGGDDTADTGGCELGDQGCGNAVFTTMEVAFGAMSDAVAAGETFSGDEVACNGGGDVLVGGTVDPPEGEIDSFALTMDFEDCRHTGTGTDVLMDGLFTMDGSIDGGTGDYSFTLASPSFRAVGTVSDAPVDFDCAFSLEYAWASDVPTFSATVCGVVLYDE